MSLAMKEMSFSHGSTIYVWNEEMIASKKDIICTDVKGRIVPVHAMKAYRLSTGIAPLILYPGTWWRWVVSFRLQPV
jgi:hypothetical protein